MLEDEQSRYIYRKRLNWLITRDYHYIGDILDRYSPNARIYPNRTIEEIEKSIGNRQIIIYGAGGDAVFYISYLRKINKDLVIGFCDRDAKLQTQGFYGYRVLSPLELTLHMDAVIIVTPSRFNDEIREYLEDIGFKSEQIIDGLFPLAECMSGMYFEQSIIHFEKEEIFVDGGAYDLSTTLSLSALAKVKKAYAFEADPNNIPKCNKTKEEYNMDFVQLYPFGLWNGSDTLSFGSEGNTKSGFYLDNKETKVEVKALDEIVDPYDNITFIKFDIEGSELEALKGSKRTIMKYKPKLAICIYHKPEDLYELPMYIKELVPEYRLYLRHYYNRAHETVMYAVL